MIEQIFIAVTGVTAIFLTQSSDPRLTRWACVFGIAGQPAWFYSAWTSGQWGILALTSLYTLAWAKGLWTHWLKPKKVMPPTDQEIRDAFAKHRAAMGRAPR